MPCTPIPKHGLCHAPVQHSLRPRAHPPPSRPHPNHACPTPAEACLAGNARGRHGLAFDPAAASCHIDDVDDAALHDLLSLLHPADDDDGNAHGPGHAPSSSDAASGLHTACQAQLLSQQHLEQERQQQELGQPLAEPVAPVLPTVKPEPLHGPEPGPGPWQGLAAGAGARLPRLRPSSQRSSTSGTSGDGVGEEPDGPPSPCHLERHCGSSTSMPAPPADGATLPGHGLPGLGGPGPACRLQQQRSFPAQMPLAAQLQPLPLQPQAAAPRARVVPKAEAVVDEDGGGSDSDAVAAGGVGQGGEELDAEHYAFGGRPLGASNARANGSAGALKKAPMPHSTIEKVRQGGGRDWAAPWVVPPSCIQCWLVAAGLAACGHAPVHSPARFARSRTRRNAMSRPHCFYSHHTARTPAVQSGAAPACSTGATGSTT